MINKRCFIRLAVLISSFAGLQIMIIVTRRITSAILEQHLKWEYEGYEHQ